TGTAVRRVGRDVGAGPATNLAGARVGRTAGLATRTAAVARSAHGQKTSPATGPGLPPERSALLRDRRLTAPSAALGGRRRVGRQADEHDDGESCGGDEAHGAWALVQGRGRDARVVAGAG